MDNEQWLSAGNCDICRRKKYCSKPCKPSRDRQAQEFVRLMMNAMINVATRHDEEVHDEENP